MSEQPRPESEAATPAATPAAPTPATPTPAAPVVFAVGEGQLQPPEHWTEEGLHDDDGDSALGDDAASSTASISSSILAYRTINGRTYHSDRGEDVQYWGPNDEKQGDTLDLQHHVFTLAQEGKLHWAPLSDDIKKVVDIGTGTGVWAIDFGDQYPEAEVIGTDLSPSQPSWVPPNVRFEIDDFTKEWTFAENSLDYVHMRWLIGSVTDWTALFKQAYKALKPGGWIESFDCNGFFQSDDGTVTEDTASSQWGLIFREGAKKLGSTASFTVVRDKLQRKALEEAGFTNIEEKLFKIPTSGWPKDETLREVGRFTRAAIENDLEGTIGFMAGQIGWTKEQTAVYAAHLRKELRAGKVHAYYYSNAAWAQKPLES